MTATVLGPTYAEMRDPTLLPAALQERARAARADERDPHNLFNITWRRPDGGVSHLVLPPSLTGVAANIIVLVGAPFPSGSHKVGPAYATLAEAETLDGVRPGTKTVVGPSTGNFGIGTAYVSLLKGYEALVVMPDTMSRERYERIRQYGAELDLTPGSESDVILTLERTHSQYIARPEYLVLAQFELLPNYRFHRFVTGDAALRAAAGYGNGRVAAFVAAPGSAGTLAAGDAIKERYGDAVVVALEPRECATLYRGGQGQHLIEGIGDKMVTLIHNVLTTDYVALIHDEDCVRGLRVLAGGGAPGYGPACACGRSDSGACLRDCLGISAVCNIIGAIKTAKLLGLGPDDNVVTVATDRFDRYPSVLAELERREGPPDAATLDAWAERIFRGADTAEMLDVRGADEKERLHTMKEQLWRRFGYGDELFSAMRGMAYWDEQVALVDEIDRRIAATRG
ncbi:MAG: pyridoxal-phosphate dependent enzyme [Chloroflexales bacterium]|nr:pyridoxal-phosphate dependent enzyme [Chloroflexales bacterium]